MQLIALFNEGRVAELESRVRVMLARYPQSGFAWKFLGLALRRQGKDALDALRKAAEFSPVDADVFYNLGNIWFEQGRMEMAEPNYQRAISLQPNHADAHFGLAGLYYAQKRYPLALSSTIQSLRIREGFANKGFFVTCVRHLQFGESAPYVREFLPRALTEPWGRPAELAEAAAMLVKFDPAIEDCVIRAIRAWPQRLSSRDLFQQIDIGKIAANKLLCTLMSVTVVCDIELERLLTTCREALLESALAAHDVGNDALLSFYGALANQCFINEYVFFRTGAESIKAAGLRDSVIAALADDAPLSTLNVLAVAAYYPLYSLPNADKLLNRQWPQAMETVLARQVREPLQEWQERSGIPRLTDIEDAVSLLVQNQYEENPYPRWIRMPPPLEPITVSARLRRLFPLAQFQPVYQIENPEILVAGCGTGQHSIEATLKFVGVRTLAIDLSMSSLAYAKRKTLEMGISTIEYAQADIMKLGSLQRRFHVIESCGVLHHMADPWAGWRVLLSLLRPGGFMRLGFYSELARRDIVKTRAFIAQQGYGSSPDEIRRCRQDILAAKDDPGLYRMTRITDFYSTSECRDLLFHVQEHRMTLPQIQAFLNENNLAFLGFEIGANILNAYRRRFPDDAAAINLGNWHIFESDNPDTFIGMYNFWIQKPA